MSGTKIGGRKARDTNLKRHGADFYKRIGAQGGLNGRGPGYKGGFASNHELAKKAGKKAGTISKRGYKFIRQEEGFREYLDKKTGKVVKFPV